MTPFADCYASSWESEKLCWDTVELYEEMAVACGHNESWLGIEDFGPLTLVCGSSGVVSCKLYNNLTGVYLEKSVYV